MPAPLRSYGYSHLFVRFVAAGGIASFLAVRAFPILFDAVSQSDFGKIEPILGLLVSAGLLTYVLYELRWMRTVKNCGPAISIDAIFVGVWFILRLWLIVRPQNLLSPLGTAHGTSFH